MIKEITKKLYEAKDAYYNDTPIMSDEEFDKLELQLKALDPNNEYFKYVGSTTKSKNKITHKVLMRSLQKAKTIDDISKWIKRLKVQSVYIATYKIDGLSCSLEYENGKLIRASTRGDGLIGQDITESVKYIKSISQTIYIEEYTEIRGELFLPKDTEFDTKGKPLRNSAVGLINRKDDKQDCSYLNFVAYNILHETDRYENEASKLAFIKKCGFETPLIDLCYTIKDIEEIYKRYLESLRDKAIFETDGLVIMVNDNKVQKELEDNNEHHPIYAIAFKPPSESTETILLDIEWNMTRHGNLVPIAIMDPVTISGRLVQKATLNNYENVINLKLHKGDKVIVKVANDVIPYFEENLTKNEKTSLDFDIKVCPFCNSMLTREGVHVNCINDNCDEKKLQKIIHYTEKCEMDQVSKQTVRLLYDNGLVTCVEELYLLKTIKDKLYVISGLGESKIENLLNQIELSREVSEVDFICRFGIPLVEKKTLEKLKIDSIEKFREFTDDSSAAGRNLIEWKIYNRGINLFTLNTIASIMKFKVVEKKDGKLFCATGSAPYKRNELIKIMEERGYLWTDTINNNLEFLMCDDVNGNSSKLQKARKLGITLISYDEFFRK